MRSFLMAAAAVVSMSATAAEAAPVISYTYLPLGFTANFGDVPGGDFTDSFTSFTVGPAGGRLSATLFGFSVLPHSTFKFLTAEVQGPSTASFTLTNASKNFTGENGKIVNAILTPGTYTLYLAGNGDAGTAFAGTLSFAAGTTPEPAAWALMILGFGAVGYAMRRRGAPTVRIAYH